METNWTQLCARTDCAKEVKGRKGKRFCSDSCRAQDWRDTNVPHCPECGASLTISITSEPSKRISTAETD